DRRAAGSLSFKSLASVGGGHIGCTIPLACKVVWDNEVSAGERSARAMDQKQNRQDNKDEQESGQPVQLDKEQQGGKQGEQKQDQQKQDQHQGGQQMPGREQQQGGKQHQGAENR